MRAFVAVKITNDCGAGAAALIEKLKAGVPGGKWVPRENLHLTLCFLGALEPGTAGKAGERLEAAAAGGPFALDFRGLGAFPSEKRASVLWAGAVNGADSAARLAGVVRSACAECGVELERREWAPHLTLARFREPVSLAGLDVFERLRETEIGTCVVDRFFLMQSHLSSGGSRYEILREYLLRGEA